MPDAGAWFGTLGVHAAVFVGTALLFGYLRRHALFRRFYASKRYAVNTKRRKPKKLPNSFFNWMIVLFNYNDSEIAEVAGVDALTYLRLQWFGVELFAGVTLMSFLIIIPVNISGGAIQDEDITPPQDPDMPAPPPPLPPMPDAPPAPIGPGYTCTWDIPEPELPPLGNLDRITMSNIPPDSDLLWAHLVVIYMIVLWALHLLWKYNLKCVVARLAYLGSVEPGAEANTVLVQDVPGLRTGSILDTVCKLIQGPLSWFTPKKVSKAIDAKIAKAFGVGAGMQTHRTKQARERYLMEEKTGALRLDLGELKAVEGEAEGDGSKTPKEFYSPRSTGTTAEEEEEKKRKQEEEEANLPDVVVMLDGKMIEPKVVEEMEDANADAASDDSSLAPPKTEGNIDIGDLKLMEKELMAYGHARKYLDNHSVEELVLKYFQDIYGEDVACVNIIPNQSDLFPVLGQYEKTAQNLDDVVNEYQYLFKRKIKFTKIKEQTVHPLLYGAWGKRFGTKAVKMEKVAFLLARLAQLKLQIEEGQNEADLTAEPAAFVTFRSRVAQTIASSALQDHDTTAWSVMSAPGPHEVIWANIGMRAWLRGLRSLVVDAAFISLVIFYGIPVSLVQAWLVEWMTQINAPDLIQSLLPGIVLKIFLAIMPYIIGFLAIVRGARSKSRVQWEMVERYFPFQVLVVFILQLFAQIGATLLSLLSDVAANPLILFNLIAKFAPAQSWYFSSYVLVLGLSGRAIELINPGPLVMFYLKSMVAVTASAKAKVLESTFFVYGAMIPHNCICILFGLVFAVQNPFLPLVVLIYFLTGSMVARYNFMYVFAEEFQSGGLVRPPPTVIENASHLVWPTVVNHVMIGVIIMEVFMTGLFFLFGASVQGILMFILIGFSMLFWIKLQEAFNRPQRVMSMAAAANMDKTKGILQVSNKDLERVYKPPVMRNLNADGKYDNLVGEAETILGKIQQTNVYKEYKGIKSLPDAPATTASNHHLIDESGNSEFQRPFKSVKDVSVPHLSALEAGSSGAAAELEDPSTYTTIPLQPDGETKPTAPSDGSQSSTTEIQKKAE